MGKQKKKPNNKVKKRVWLCGGEHSEEKVAALEEIVKLMGKILNRVK